ncbi:hypothetical protein JCM10914_2061 [Paenibacillus sp. JCM 10914]|nr:hypothetical protein JCM10914_2061 [Paenibacillus sp. JCM 10914]
MAVPAGVISAAPEMKNLIYDDAGLLTMEERNELNAMANEYGAERDTDFIIFTTNNEENIDVIRLTQNFYDEYEQGPGRTRVNAAILTLDRPLDIENRELYLAGFYKAEEYLDNARMDKIRNRITPDLSSGNYKQAFETYIKTAHRYMGFEPGRNPDNILFNLWFQLGAAAALGAIVVGIMAYRSGGRVTVNRRTYEDAATSAVLEREDRYIRTTTTKRKIPKNTGGSGGGGSGGGGISRGGHSHSGSRGKF